MICAAERTNIVPIIRISEIQKTYILKALDVGAMGIVFSMVNTLEEAKRAVSLSKYIQKRNQKRERFRGLMYISRVAGYGITVNEKCHIETSNKEITIIIQFETKEVINNLDEILKL